MGRLKLEKLIDNYKVVGQYLNKLKKRDGHQIIFEENLWDDFSFKTTFEVYYHDDKEIPKTIGSIQIANIEEAKQKSEFESYKTFKNISKEFTKLEPTYISLGNTEYYKNIHEIFKDDAPIIFKDLNDIMYFDHLYEKYKSEDVVKVSFFRDLDLDSDSPIIEELKKLSKEGTRISYNFKINYEKNSLSKLELCFKSDDSYLVPTNMHAIIGKNGTGKSTLLKDLLKASLNSNNRIESLFDANTDEKMYFNIKDNNNSKQSDPVMSSYFNKIIYVSFSIFDTMPDFEIDTNIEFKMVGKTKEDSGERFDIETQKKKFENYLKKLVNNRESLKLFAQTISELKMFRPDLYKRSVYEIDEMDDKSKEEYLEKIKKLYEEESSSGQRIVLQALVAFITEIEPRTLVIFDEPELHLHPPLLSNFIRSISKILSEKNGLGILATHSPVVLQEIPSVNVYILDNKETFISAQRPKNETFGENISTLMDTVFELDIKESGFYNFIKKIVESRELSEKDIRDIPFGRDGDLYKRLLLSKQNSNNHSERDDY